MQIRPVLLAPLAALTAVLATGCKGVDCGEGTTARNGICVPASETVGMATCGTNTILQGDTCVSQVKCGDGTTESAPDQTGLKTCIGTGAGATGCAAKLACPTPGNGKQTICGQIYDFETGDPFADAGATGTQCTAATATGPCALGVKAYDAVVFAGTNGASGELAVGATYLDDCGRYRLTDISQPSQGLVAVGVDDTATKGPGGLASPIGVSLAFFARATPDVEAFTVKSTTVIGYAAGGGPSIASGIYALMFRSRSTGSELAAGVTVTRNIGAGANTDAAHDYYFGANSTTRTTLEATNVTGVNGTALFTITPPIAPGDMYSGTGGTQCNCVWPSFPAAPVSGVMFVQIFRPTSASSGTPCPL